MGELIIRRNRSFAVPQYQEVSKAEKPAGSGRSQKAAGTAAAAAPEALLMSRGSQAESLARAGYRTLQTGDVALAEVQDALSHMAQVAEEAADGTDAGRGELQTKLEQLVQKIDRVLTSALAGDTQLFLDEDMGIEDGLDTLLQTVLGELSAGGDTQALPDWLLKSMTQSALSANQLLASLGLDKSASAAELLSAIAGSSLEGSSAAGYLAAVYLGTVIAGGDPSRAVDPQEALAGLQQLLEKVAEGVPPDEALALLTGGRFSGFEDFQSQFIGGTAPGLEAFLVSLLLSEDAPLLSMDASLLSLLSGLESANFDLLMGLFSSAQSSGTEPGPGPASADSAGTAVAAGTDAASDAAPASTLSFGAVEVSGRDLSGISFDESTGTLTVGGTADVTVQGTEEAVRSIQITGSGAVTLQNVKTASLVIGPAASRILTGGENVWNEVLLRDGASPVFDGSGLAKIGVLRGEGSGESVLRLAGGAMALTGKDGGSLGTLSIPVVLDGPVSLAAYAPNVTSSGGKPLDFFDVLWKTMLPGWSGLTSMELDGRQAKLALWGSNTDLARLWLEKGDLSPHGYPVHTLIMQGRDEAGRPLTRYAYLHWSQQAGTFEEISVYPNPFTVTGGEENRDWIYEEESHTLRILSGQVTAISGGAGTDANQVPFSGRIALADSIGAASLTLGGVVCRVSSGRAFDLGRANDVTLVLQSGTDNFFESGPGCAGISLGDGTTLCIDGSGARGSDRNPAGTLTASGGKGGAGIGRDGGGGRDQTSHIQIRGGVITASGAGGGAGIGAGRRGRMGSITITGGTITSTGGTGGGAGIGGALGAPVGDISIHGGKVTAIAVYHAAAIGAGLQGQCGNILITGTARIVKALGGDPGADIGACLFGACGKVNISGGANIGSAQLWTRTGIALQTGDGTVTLPQFRLSAKSLGLDKLNILTRESAQTARAAIDRDRRWVSQIQTAYSALYSRLERGGGGFWYDKTQGLNRIRDFTEASSLFQDVRQSIPLPSSQAMQTHSRQGTGDVRRLLR